MVGLTAESLWLKTPEQSQRGSERSRTEEVFEKNVKGVSIGGGFDIDFVHLIENTQVASVERFLFPSQFKIQLSIFLPLNFTLKVHAKATLFQIRKILPLKGFRGDSTPRK